MAFLTRRQDGWWIPRGENVSRPDLSLLGAVVVLSGFGLLMIYSATRAALQRRELLPSASVERQMIFMVLGLAVMVLLSYLDYRDYRVLVPIFYVVCLAALGVAFLFDPVKGVQRWITLGPINIQPAEFTKLVLVLVLASLLSSDPDASTQQLPWRKVLYAVALAAVPMALIFLQPDLGTMMSYPAILLLMLFVSGATRTQLATLVLTAIGSVLTVWRLGLLAGHQIDRLRVFADPELDPQGLGWSIRQARLAISSGQLTGQGLFQGAITNQGLVPEQESDFIFTAIGEQMGFVGGLAVLIVFCFILWRLLRIAVSAPDQYGSLLATGVAVIVMFHVFISVGMTLGIVPITGLPLPLLSQGGSFYLTVTAGVGMCLSVWRLRPNVWSSGGSRGGNPLAGQGAGPRIKPGPSWEDFV
jgi:rod shape determining protein RodA